MPSILPSSSILSRHRKLITRRHLRKYSWLPDVLRVKHSIVPRIIGPVFTMTIFSALVAYGWSLGKPVTLTNSVTPLLAVVVGLILVFRNGTSYDRYYDGRKAFGALTSQVRNLSRLIWIQVALPPTDDANGKTPSTDITPQQLRRRKVDALKLTLAFAYAVKHYLREEDGVAWDDYVDVIPRSFTRAHQTTAFSSRRNSNATSYNAISDTITQSPDKSRATTPERGMSTEGTTVITTGTATKRVRVKRSKDKLPGAKTPLLGSEYRVDFNPYTEASIPLPLIMAHELTRMLFAFRRDGLLETVGPAGVNAMNQGVSSLVEQLTAVERIANTPIPKSYSIHLKQCVSLYLFALPFTLVKELGWATIPIVTVVAFTFMGIEGIAEEIEMPFGLDESDLPLDRYCSDLKEEINYIIDRLPEGGQGGYGWDDGEGDD
ncbi:UPF0187-domain-containing protein [Artomyces pyxidatus]|uniref:UPF0187-domain-containing protein n=1 Tax=Artomyces pyxidatus TaxID=48021 RepID=A0ACB8SXB5_9AGAM|nr:UPF0187-domain-containing protein [Artomyces pyxidatus]